MVASTKRMALDRRDWRGECLEEVLLALQVGAAGAVPVLLLLLRAST